MTVYRRPTLADFTEMLRLAREMHAETSFKALTFSESKCASEITRCIHDTRMFVCVADRGDKLIGMAGGYRASPFFSDDPVVFDHIWYVDEEARGSLAGPRLLQELEKWSRSCGAKALFVTLGSGVNRERVGELVERLGFQCLGGYFRKDLGDA